MRALIFTTKTEHHDYFVKSIHSALENFFVIYEKKVASFGFKTNHSKIKKRHKFEKKYFKSHVKEKNYKNIFISNINNLRTIKLIKSFKPNIIIVFGTSILSKKIINACRNIPLINLHGGDPEKYRGLDSHFWCLYHKDFNSLVTTLHYIDEGIDTGNIIQKIKINNKPKISFNNLRIKNVENCVDLVLKFISRTKRGAYVKGKKQKFKGRYYSAFPSIFIDKAYSNLKKN